jgi:serine/threonine protein kinase
MRHEPSFPKIFSRRAAKLRRLFAATSEDSILKDALKRPQVGVECSLIVRPFDHGRFRQDELIADRYRAGEEIGRGGMGIVFRALDIQLDRPVALKMLLPEATHDIAMRRRLASEARTASVLNHPGIAIVFDFVEAPEASFIVYELVAGRTLRSELAAGPFSIEELVEAGVQLADALSAAHQLGVMHRDLKPENIMVAPGDDGRGRMKILDFGLARRFALPLPEGECASAAATITELTALGLAAGTTAYMSPEQLQTGQADARGDIYALGLILYELAAGCHPFRGTSVSATIANILTQTAAPITRHNPAAPAEIDRIIQKCLRKRPVERYQSAKELLTDLRNFRADPFPGDSALGDPAGKEPQSLLRNLIGAEGSRTYRFWEILHVKACLRCALLVWFAWLFKTDSSGTGSLFLFFSAIVCCTIQGLLSAVLLTAGAADRRNLRTYARQLAPWLRAFGLANGLLAFLMGAIVAESHSFLAVLLVVLGVLIGFTALVLKPAMDRAVIYSSE